MTAARAVNDPPGARLHVVNGDGASLCERVPAGQLLRTDDLVWADVPRDMRCSQCQILLTSYGVGHL